MHKNSIFKLRKARFLKRLLVIKVMTLFLLLNFLQGKAEQFFENVTLSLKNAPIEKVFREIQKQTGYHFFYNEKLIRDAKKITIEVKDVSVQSVLQLCFKEQPFGYAIEDKQIIIKAKENTPADEKTIETVAAVFDITGVITDAEGKVLPGATVRLKGTTIQVVADQSGSFNLQSTVASGVLIVSFVGYETKEVAFSGSGSVTIVLALKESKAEEIGLVGNYKNIFR